MATLLDGKIVASAVKDRLKGLVSALPANGPKPGLAVVLVGEDPGSKIYVANKEKACQEIGFHSVVKRLPESTSQEKFWIGSTVTMPTQICMDFLFNCPCQKRLIPTRYYQPLTQGKTWMVYT